MTTEERFGRFLDSVSAVLLGHLGLVADDADVAEAVLVEVTAWEGMNSSARDLVPRLTALANVMRALRYAAEAQEYPSARHLRQHEDALLRVRDAVARRQARQ